MAGQRELDPGCLIELHAAKRHEHVRFAQIEEDGIELVQERADRGRGAQLRPRGALDHAHEEARADAVSRDVGHVADPAWSAATRSTRSPPTSPLGTEMPQNSKRPTRLAIGGTR